MLTVDEIKKFQKQLEDLIILTEEHPELLQPLLDAIDSTSKHITKLQNG